MGGGLALDGGVDREHDFGKFRRPGDQSVDAEVLGTDSVERREHAAKHVVADGAGPGALHGPEIGHVLDHDQQAGFPTPRVRTDGTG